MTSLFLAPHSDDEALFGAFTLMRVKPIVLIVTDGTTQYIRDGNPSPHRRWQESVEACALLGCPVIRGRMDDSMTRDDIRRMFEQFSGFDTVYAPALQYGNPHHDMVYQGAVDVFKNIVFYSTYCKDESYAGDHGFIGHAFKEVMPTDPEIALKRAALKCYDSQLKHKWTTHHFNAMWTGRSEWLAS